MFGILLEGEITFILFAICASWSANWSIILLDNFYRTILLNLTLYYKVKTWMVFRRVHLIIFIFDWRS